MQSAGQVLGIFFEQPSSHSTEMLPLEKTIIASSEEQRSH